MNYAIFLGIMNLILLSRMRLMLKDTGIRRGDMLIMGGIPLLALPFLQVNASWFMLLIYFIAYPPLTLLSERSEEKVNRNRGLFLLMHLLVVGLLCSPVMNLVTNSASGWLLSVVDEVFVGSGMFTMKSVTIVQLFLFGLLMVLNEANIMLRFVFRLTGLQKLGMQGEEVDQQEYNTGRIIGLLERIFVFLFVLMNQYTAIGFILATKGVARFQDFKSRTFAEYVLIGTLLSALLAMGMAFIVKGVLLF